MTGPINSDPVKTFAVCWTIERRDGAGVALTSHDRPMTQEGAVFSPSPGIVPAAVTSALGLEPQSSEVSGALSAAAIEAHDLAAGRWDGARVTASVCDWSTETPVTELVRGELGSVDVAGEEFSAELLGVASKLGAPICPSTSPVCRADFGDKKCRVDLAGRTRVAIVTGVDGSALTLDQAVDPIFLLGRLRYLDGLNCGAATIVTTVSGATVTVRDLPILAVQSGARVELREGCDKAFATCVERFDNAVNFRGEPHLPGIDQVTRYPGI